MYYSIMPGVKPPIIIICEFLLAYGETMREVYVHHWLVMAQKLCSNAQHLVLNHPYKFPQVYGDIMMHNNYNSHRL